MEEVWKNIDGFSGEYQISTSGYVKSVHRVITRVDGVKRTVRERYMKPYLDSMGYYVVHLKSGGFNSKKYIHRLLAEAFLDNQEGKGCVNHKDGNKLNNSLENLEWCTSSENNIHAVETGLRAVARSSYKSPCSVLTKEQRLFILDNYSRGKKGFNTKKLGDMFGVSKTTVSKVLKQGRESLNE